MNCVDSDNFSAESAPEIACIKNCQDKVYQSFQLYMGIRTRKEAMARTNIDKSAYIGMESEHSNDTGNEIIGSNQKSLNVKSVQTFMAKNKRDNKDIRLEAFKK